MTADVVVDANVLAHSQNPAVPWFEMSVEFIEALRESAVFLCVDEGFALIEANNRSIIGREYLDQLRFGSNAYAVVAHLGLTGRIRYVSDRVANAERQFIRRAVPRNTRDQLYVRVTYNSHSRRLVTHDLNDFSPDVRDRLETRLGIRFFDAEGCSADIAAA